MDTKCPNCRGLVGADMRCCARSGKDISSSPGPRSGNPPRGHGILHTLPPIFAPMPYPPPYQLQWTLGRIAFVTGGILIISDGCMALFLGLIIYMSTDFLIGTFLILPAIAAILGGLFLFIPPYPRMGVVGPVLLIPVYAWVMIELPGVAQFATIGIILAVIGLILAVLGYKDSQQRERSRWKPSTPMAHGPPIGQPPPPEYGRRPGGLP